MTNHSRVALGKKKFLQVQQTVKLGIAKTLNIDLVQEDSLNKLSKEVQHKANDMDILTGKIKEKVISSITIMKFN